MFVISRGIYQMYNFCTLKRWEKKGKVQICLWTIVLFSVGSPNYKLGPSTILLVSIKSYYNKIRRTALKITHVL